MECVGGYFVGREAESLRLCCGDGRWWNEGVGYRRLTGITSRIGDASYAFPHHISRSAEEALQEKSA